MAEKRFLDFLDRIDGGGMGQSGDTFEGGGLLSMLGNVFASPYGSQNPERRARRDAFYAGQMGGEPMAASGFNPAPVRTANQRAPTLSTTYERERLNPPTAFTPVSPARDPYDMRENRYGPQAGPSLPPELEASYTGMPAPAQQYSTSGMNPTNVYKSAQERFARQLVEMLGPDDAQTLMTSNLGLQAYQAFIANNYNMPNY